MMEFGKEFIDVSGQAAIDRLIHEKCGHVKSAFYREGIGHIDLLWGNDKYGLQKIIKRRNSEGFDGESFLSEINNVIRNGRVKLQKNGRFLLSQGDKRVVISPHFDNQSKMFVFTAFEIY
ncbi:MAG: hypothetical protein FWF81_08355 [Defluviitaleaceae bacterium]|nr:hypothetical protein [Defluviitaleaceae bacterium]